MSTAAAPARARTDWLPYLLVTPVLLVMLPFFVLPLGVLLRNSFDRDDPRLLIVRDATIDNYLRILGDGYYANIFLNSLVTAFLVAAITLVVAYPFVWYLVRQTGRKLSVLMWFVYLPLIVSVITRVYGWMVITADSGVINTLLASLGITDGPLHILFDRSGMMIGMVHRYLPLMILPLYSALSRLNGRVLTASASLGATGRQTFLYVTLPLSLPGIFVGIQLTVAVVLSDYVLPLLLGTTRYAMVAPAIYDEAISMVRWASAATMAVVTIAIVALVIVATNLLRRWLAPWSRGQ